MYVIHFPPPPKTLPCLVDYCRTCAVSCTFPILVRFPNRSIIPHRFFCFQMNQFYLILFFLILHKALMIFSPQAKKTKQTKRNRIIAYSKHKETRNINKRFRRCIFFFRFSHIEVSAIFSYVAWFLAIAIYVQQNQVCFIINSFF